jgi:steroid delta-isomerase-like uncharacterized protein
LTAQNLATIDRWFAEGINQGNLDSLGDLFTRDVTAHEPFGEFHGIDEGPKRSVEALRSAFPDFHITVEERVADGDRVAVRWSATGTHDGDFMGIPPTGKKISLNAIYIYRFENARIAEVWASPDALGLLQQLGAIPSP